MQPFTLDQAIIAALLFLLGLLIGMFFMAGGSKWKRHYLAESARTAELTRENERLGAEVREFESLRHAAAKAPAHPVAAATPATRVVHEEVRVVETSAQPYRRVTSTDGDPDIVIKRP